MSKLIKKSKGFTLIELMVVMALITVLMGMAFGAMTGVKGSSLESQVQSDASTTQKAVDKYSNQSIKGGIFPEYNTGATFPATVFPDTAGLKYNTAITSEAFYGKDGVQITKPTNSTHSAIKWDATVNVWLKDGSVEAQPFMPIYMTKTPESVVLLADEADKGALNEFLWLLEKSGTAEATNRKVEVYRLKTITGNTIGYQQVY